MKKTLAFLGAFYLTSLLLVSFTSCSSTDLRNAFKSPTAKVIGRIATNAALNAAAARIGADSPIVAQALNDIVIELNATAFGSTDLEGRPALSDDAAQLLADLEATVKAARTKADKQAAVDAVLKGLRARATLSK